MVPPVCQTSQTSHHPKKKFLNRIHALITSPKRALGHAEREGVGHSRPRTGSTASSTTSDASTSPSTTSSPTSPTSPTSSHSKPHRKASKRTVELPNGSVVETAEKDDAVEAKAEEPQVISGEQQAVSPSADVMQQQTLVRPHLKIRIVTWNMHDSLPTGDLTELLGHPTSSETGAELPEIAGKITALEPSHAVQPLSDSSFNHEAPYHLVVVGGQEVPIGYGGWAGPNWTELIQRWLEGAQEIAQPQQDAQSLQSPRPAGDIPESAVVDEDLEGDDEDDQAPTPHGPALTVSPSVQQSEQALSPGVLTAQPGLHNQLQPAPSTPLSTSPSRPLLAGSTHAPMSDTLALPSGQSSLAPSAISMTQRSHSATSSSSASSGGSTSSEGTTVGTTVNQSAEPHEHTQQQEKVTQVSTSPYNLIAKERLMGIYVSLWAHKSISTSPPQGSTSGANGNKEVASTTQSAYVNLIQGTSTGTVTAGLLNGKWGNKGAACIALHIANTRLLFVCAHLAAHSERSNARQQNVKKIKDELVIDTFRTPPTPAANSGSAGARTTLGRKEMAESRTSLSAEDAAKTYKEKERDRLYDEKKQRMDKGEDITDAFDYTFWFGDLNFRLDISRVHADFLIKQKDYKTALSFDQLKPILNEPKGCFQGFQEAEIGFAPSYKYDVLKLKRSRTLGRTNTSASLTTLADLRRLKHMSAPAGSAGASRTTLPIGEEDEEEVAERATIASSRASISSAFSGFETIFDDDGNPIPREQLGRETFSSPGTPSAEKVLFDKAKNFFGLSRSKSSAQVPTRVMPPPTPGNGTEKMEYFSPSASHASANAIANEIGPILIPDPHASASADVQLSESAPPSTDSRAIQATSVANGINHVPKAGIVKPSTTSLSQSRPFTPTGGPSISISSPMSPFRPRLQSQRSSQTILSLSEAQQKLSHERQLEQDAVFDSSSKKRVQSWTDRILYKSTIRVESDEVELNADQSHGSRHIGSGFLDSLRGVKRSIMSAGSVPSGASAPNTRAQNHRPTLQPKKGMHRVSFSPSTVQEPIDGPSSAAMGRTSSEHAQPSLLRRNTSRSSLGETGPAGSQQRLNQRFARIFSRHNSQPRPSTPEVASASSSRAPSVAQSSTSSPAASNSGASSPEKPKRLVRSFSASSRRRTNLPRTKPSRSYTTPCSSPPTFDQAPPSIAMLNGEQTLPVSDVPLSATTIKGSSSRLYLSDTATVPMYPADSTWQEEPLESEPQLIMNTESRSRADTEVSPKRTRPGFTLFSTEADQAIGLLSPQAGSPISPGLASADRQSEPVLQHGQTVLPPSPHLLPPQVQGPSVSFANAPGTEPIETGYASQAEGEGMLRAPGAGRAFSFSNPLGGLPYTKTFDERTDAQPASARTGITITHARTTPVSTGVMGRDTQAHSGAIRQWWNSHLFLPSFLNRDDPHAINDTSTLADSNDTTPTSQTPFEVAADNETSISPAQAPLLPPPPIIIGPKRGEVQCLTYDAVADLRRMQAQSDHRPVVACFALGI